MSEKKWRFDTLVIHGSQTPELWRNASLAPIYQSAAHRYDSAEELSEVFAGKKEGFTYQRLNNPTNEVLEKRLALENRIRQELVGIEHALDKFEKGTYGSCDNCGQPIDPERLEALPQASLCMNCKALLAKNAKGKPPTG